MDLLHNQVEGGTDDSVKGTEGREGSMCENRIADDRDRRDKKRSEVR